MATTNIKTDLHQLAEYYGFDFVDLKHAPNYSDRKGHVWGLIDRRTKILVCVHATKQQILDYLSNLSKKP